MEPLGSESAEPGERQVLADRVHHYNAPLTFMFDALTVDRARWLRVQPGDVEPRVIEAVPFGRVVWSSFWPVSPRDTIEFDLTGKGSTTAIRLRWFTNSPPDERGIAITRQRLNQKLGGDIRAVVSEYFWNHVAHRP